MPFRYHCLKIGHYEVIMEPNTLHIGGRKSGEERRFARCTHENDAEVITDALNTCEKLGLLK